MTHVGASVLSVGTASRLKIKVTSVPISAIFAGDTSHTPLFEHTVLDSLCTDFRLARLRDDIL
ncbi:MAG: hypothetical protein ACXV2F_00535, partial [Halobacteriota archaeon]